jgi:D-alanyl-lipoteichoic acid acyltransferase DltB (MBOAT superfamily)
MCWEPAYAILLLISTVVDYTASRQIDRAKSVRLKKTFLVISASVNLGILFLFKYFNFFSHAIKDILGFLNIQYAAPAFEVLLPIGISFYTFQTLGYTIDVYRGTCKPEKHIGIFALYVSFFPQLVAGPIERATRLLPQFYKKHRFDLQRCTQGLTLMLWGFFKKIVIADRLGLYVDQVFGNPAGFSGYPLILAAYFFSFQIYCDFSAYSDIAIGGARILGIDLMKNFNKPYFAASIPEFWRRWHISLSTWFRDYLYIPLGGNRDSRLKTVRNIFIVFLLCGLWHGSNWTFIVWGGLHALYLLVYYSSKKTRDKSTIFRILNKKPLLAKLFCIFLTFNAVSFSWIFFRLPSLSDACVVIREIPVFFINRLNTGLNGYELCIAITAIAFLVIIEILQGNRPFYTFVSEIPVYYRWPLYYLLIIGIVLFGEFRTVEFIYFQF